MQGEASRNPSRENIDQNLDFGRIAISENTCVMHRSH